ncbi:MAG: bifunctional 2-methylcitrate dehydratase/aconitate hydratase [Gammaproteobacteria bacterium]|nr:bifunctional 2-methylcitrate dehydratase/aconitate hydratase [Gammaproteobacteria bacterium]
MMNPRSNYDAFLGQLVDYVLNPPAFSVTAIENAGWSFLDALGCGIFALKFPACKKLLGPVVPGAVCTKGARVPGFDWELDPVQAAFNIGTMVRWLDYNDTWLAAEWGHPSDNCGAILATIDYVHRQGLQRFTLQEVLHAMIQAYEIQGIIALNHAFNRQGLDHVILVKLASALVCGKILGLDQDGLLRLASQVFVDGQSLRTYRHAPNTGSRKSWAAGDATARAVRLALITKTGEMGYPSALSAEPWGFSAVSFAHQPLHLLRPLGNYVMENILWKISYPAEFHAQTAVECAIEAHSLIRNRIEDIERIEIRTQEPSMRIISKKGILKNPADRDHCLEYMIAIGLIHGELNAHHYEDDAASHPQIENLRQKMVVTEDSAFTKDYYDLSKRSIANGLRIHFQDGTHTDWIVKHYPIGHPRRREEGLPLLKQKFEQNIAQFFDAKRCQEIQQQFLSNPDWYHLGMDDFYQLMTP